MNTFNNESNESVSHKENKFTSSVYFFLAFEVYLLETLLTRQHHILFLHLTIGSRFAPDPLNKEVYSRLVLVHPIRYSSYSVKIFNPSLDVMSISSSICSCFE